MSRILEVELSQAGLEKAARWLENYAKGHIPKSANELVGKMCQEGEAFAIMEETHIDTGETVSTIHGYRNGNKGVIVAGGSAIWIEFGTGVARNTGTGHPRAGELGMSPWGTYGQGKGASPNGWWYKGDDGKYHHTYGMPMTPFMYNTAQMMRKDAPKWAKEIFSK